MKSCFALLIFIGVATSAACSQDVQDSMDNGGPDPRAAFLRSLAVPGWGHHYVDSDNWNRGKYHLAAEASLILSYIGFRIHSGNLEQNWITYARQEAGIDIASRDRFFRLAVGDFNNLEAYNDFQERSRNWNLLLDDVPGNRWFWDSESKRDKYNDLRNRFENIDNQLPALLALMAVNRIVSGLSAYNRARKAKDNNGTATSIFFSPLEGVQGVTANLRIRF